MTAGQCLNCAAPLQDAQHFCGACGQRTSPRRLTFSQMLSDFTHALTHADHSIFALIRGLAFHPGHVSREYVDGKRKRHFGPLAFLLLAAGLASFMILATGVKFFSPEGESAAAEFLQRHINVVVLLQMPVLAGLCALLFRDEKLHYAEHLVLSAYTSGFRILVLGLLATPAIALLKISPASPSFVPWYMGLWLAYFSFAAAQFYRASNVFWVITRAVLAAVIGQVVTIYTIYVFIVSFERLRTH